MGEFHYKLQFSILQRPQMKNAAGLIFDYSPHYIDHLGPFCALRKWPLIVCEENLANLARRYYPDLEVIEANRWDLVLPPLVISCDPRQLIDSAFPNASFRKLLWLPHGHSDKGWAVSNFEPLRDETALVYGQKMLDDMHRQNVFPRAIRLGNFRLSYWMRHQLFYEQIVIGAISLPKAKATYLYAPTWNDREGNGSFWETFPLLAENLPDRYNLIVKIHPNTEWQFAPEIERLVGRYARSNILFLPEFPPIYPLLNICDAYIGDMSSIGYDFLYWKRPMYFLKQANCAPYLHRCGTEFCLDEISSIFHQSPVDRMEIQTQTYAYTFDSAPYLASYQ